MKRYIEQTFFPSLIPRGWLKLIINFICKLLGIAIHFTNSLDFFTFSNFPFAYFFAYFLYISVISHFHPITRFSHSPSTPPFSSYCNPPTHSFHILSNRLKHPFYPTSPFSFHPKFRHFLSIFILQLFFYFLSIHTIPSSL